MTKFDRWLTAAGYTDADARVALGVSGRSTIRRYRSGEQLPTRAVMQRIYRWTNGAVTPNDFYDLPGSTVPAAREARHVAA